MEINLLGFYNHNNFGDTLMSQELYKQLLYSGHKSVTLYSDKKGSEAIDYKDGFNYEADLNIIGGGGIVTPNFWFFKQGLDKKLKDGSKLGLLNVNLTSESIPLLRAINDKLSFAVVRDYASFELINNIRSHGSNFKVLVAPDVSFLRSKIETVDDEKYVSICLNSYVLNNYFSQDRRKQIYAEKFLTELSSFLIWVKSFGHKIQLIPSQVDREINDNRASALLDGMIGGADNWIYDNEFTELYLAYSNLVISMRYHTTLAAVKYGIPFIDISHHSKNLNFLKENKLDDLSIDYWSCSLEQLKETANKAKYSSQIPAISKHYSVSSIEAWNQVRNMLSTILQS